MPDRFQVDGMFVRDAAKGQALEARWNVKTYRTPVSFELVRQDAGANGNIEGFYHKGFLAGNEWIYKSPFIPARLNDDEIAIATCLDKMAQYVAGGPDCNSQAEASQDHYISLMIQHALASHEVVRTTMQSWA